MHHTDHLLCFYYGDDFTRPSLSFSPNQTSHISDRYHIICPSFLCLPAYLQRPFVCQILSFQIKSKQYFTTMQVFQWEDRHQDTPFHVHLIAGSLAGISEHLSMIPIDNLKTHCQVGRKYSVGQAAAKIYKAGGLANFYAGSSIVVFGCAPAHAIYFSIYEKALQALECRPEEDFGKLAFVGALSAMFHDLIMTPAEALKQRMQLMRSENLKVTVGEVAASIIKREGAVAFYRSFPVNYAMNVPFGSLIVAFNQKLKHHFGVRAQDQSIKYYLCGAIAGAIASIPTTPLDVIKTKLNTQNCTESHCEKAMCSMLKAKPSENREHSQGWLRPRTSTLLTQSREGISTIRETVKYRNIWDTTAKIMQQDGVLGFFKGLQMRMMIQSVSSGVAWGTYHVIKQMLVKKHNH